MAQIRGGIDKKVWKVYPIYRYKQIFIALPSLWNEKEECIVEIETPEDTEKFDRAMAQLSKKYEDWSKKGSKGSDED